jgi:hypothetical protein
MLQRVGQCLTGAAAPSGWPKLAAVLARCFALLCFAAAAAASLKLQLSATARGGRGEFPGACALEVVRLKEELRKMPPDEAPGVSAATVSLAPTAFHLSESPSPLNFMCLRLRLLRPKSCLKK